jgi:hypothetical protein
VAPSSNPFRIALLDVRIRRYPGATEGPPKLFVAVHPSDAGVVVSASQRSEQRAVLTRRDRE